MIWIASMVGIFYCLLTVALLYGWRKALFHVPTVPPAAVFNKISVIVAVRNEEANIRPLIENLAALDYPQYEVIIVDDHSSDATVPLTRALIKQLGLSSFRLIGLTSGEGKKHAITHGVNHSSGHIIVTTDCDCQVPSYWLMSINAYFLNPSLKMLIGGVAIQPTHNLYSSLQALEFSALIGSGAATLMLGFPTMCNGANLAYRKEVFEEVNGYEDNLHIPSGDDEFLMRKVFSKYPYGVKFNNADDSVVGTKPLASIRSFFNQRIRWAGKWRYHQTMMSKLLAIMIFCCHVTHIALWYFLFMEGTTAFYLAGSILLLKGFLEYKFLSHVKRFLKSEWNWPAFILCQVGYSFYVVTFALLANGLSFEWKGRKLSSARKEFVPLEQKV